MKQLLSGNDWKVSHFTPGEVHAYTPRINWVSNGYLYGGSFIDATVPGDVQSDCIDAGLIEDINYGFNARKAEWTYQRDWLYVKKFNVEDIPCKHIRLCFDGVDYDCEVFLNGKYLGSHEVAWIPFQYDVTEDLLKDKENCLCVLVKYAPAAECQWGRTASVKNLKARFAYQWDWCTRLVPLGIWKDVYLKYEQDAAIDDLYVYSDVDYAKKAAVVHAEAVIRGQGAEYKTVFALKHPDGHVEHKEVIASEKAYVEFEVSDAALWYPNGMGEQPLYEVSVVLEEGWDEQSARIGLRHIEWKQTEGAEECALLYQPYINGRRVYLQGFNWTPIRQLYGRVHKDAYYKRLLLCKRSGANYLRIWGGGLLEREEFYEYCNEMGILVMQELFQSSCTGNNHPSKDPEFVQLLLSAVESAVIQKRNHPSLICWCGGNELTYRGEYIDGKGNILIEGVEGKEGYGYDVSKFDYMPLSPEYPTLKAMEEVIHKLDPSRMWFHTSGSGPHTHGADLKFVGGKMHDVHGPWGWVNPVEVYKFYNALDMMVHHEFGFAGATSIQTLEQTIPDKYRWPLDDYNPMAQYHGSMWIGNYYETMPFFGEFKDYKSYITGSRFVQWEQSRYALEAHRRLGNKCACSCLWHYGEPWPNVSDNCSVDVFDQVKPAYYGQAAAFQPLHLAPRYEAIIHNDVLEAEMTLYNTTLVPFTGEILVQLYALDGTLLGERTFKCSAEPDTVVQEAAKMSFEHLPNGPLFLCQSLLDENGNVVDSGYSIHAMHEKPYAELLTQPQCEITATLDGNSLTLENKGAYIASGLTVECCNDKSVMFSDGCIMLLPGEKKEIILDTIGDDMGVLYISGFGVPYQELKLNA